MLVTPLSWTFFQALVQRWAVRLGKGLCVREQAAGSLMKLAMTLQTSVLVCL